MTLAYMLLETDYIKPKNKEKIFWMLQASLLTDEIIFLTEFHIFTIHHLKEYPHHLEAIKKPSLKQEAFSF